MTTRVIHFRDAPPGWQSDPQYVYIGRAMPRYGLKASKWANPYKVGRDGSREHVIALFQALVSPSMIADARRELRGKTLICWCKPAACHGDILVHWAEDGLLI